MACKRSRFFSGDTLTESEKTTAAPPVPASGTSYTWDEAASHIGETATVTGPVIDSIDVPFPDGRTDPVLSVGEPFGPGAFMVRLMMDRDALPEDLYVGKTISVTGKIIPNPFGGAAIWITDLSQIQIKVKE
jgi:hypothetical protein